GYLKKWIPQPSGIDLVVLPSVSGSLPIRDGGIPRRGTIDLQIDDHLLEFGAIGLAHLVLHERLRTFLPHLVVQNALWVTHILDQRSLNECLFLHDVGEDFLEFCSELPPSQTPSCENEQPR